MNKLLILLCFSFFSLARVHAQTSAPKFALLDAKDPIVGTWKFVANDTAAPVSPFGTSGWYFIRFAAGTEQSVASESAGDVMDCPFYFLCFSNGTTVSTTLSDNCDKSLKGKKFKFSYSYDAASDQLTITGTNGAKAVYSRVQQ
ncbi:MAG TPA: hypothetical protein VL651_12590 [Bacteroidia bacterium]|jgi:hypothetical protein|nr:hypothetical protein [Bacteroidia bacterium]